MSQKQHLTDPELAGLLKHALDDLDRMKALMRGVIITLDDVQGRIVARHIDRKPGPWDDEHPERAVK